MNWIEVPRGKYTLVPRGRARKSTCQIELAMRYSDFISHSPEGEWSRIAPLRILSFDIECAGRKGIFPEPEQDPVIQIANMVTRQGIFAYVAAEISLTITRPVLGETQPFIRNVFTLNTCAHIVGSQVIEHQRESDMLVAWRDFIVEADPDVIIGYNIANFDFPYLLDRAKALDVDSEFARLGRYIGMLPSSCRTMMPNTELLGVKTQTKDTHFSSKAYGQRDTKETVLDGRIQLDLLQYMQREQKLRSYTLNAVCAHFLGEQKEDVHHSVITELQNGTPESRRRLAVYCLKVRLHDQCKTYTYNSGTRSLSGCLSSPKTYGQIDVFNQLHGNVPSDRRPF